MEIGGNQPRGMFSLQRDHRLVVSDGDHHFGVPQQVQQSQNLEQGEVGAFLRRQISGKNSQPAWGRIWK
jgi:hypothetical protein